MSCSSLAMSQIRALDVIDAPTQSHIATEVRRILTTEHDAHVAECEKSLAALRAQLAATTVNAAPIVVSANLALEGARDHVSAVRDHLSELRGKILRGRASRKSSIIDATRDELEAATNALREAKASHDSAIVRALSSVHISRMGLRVRTGTAYGELHDALKKRRAQLNKHAEKHRRSLSNARRRMVDARRIAIREAMEQVDRFAAAAVDTQQSFVRGSQLPFHQWMASDPQLAAWMSDATFFDAFEQIVSDVKKKG